MGFFFLPIFWMFLFVWITLADLYLLTNQLLVYKFACMLGTYIVPTNLIPENYLVTCTLFKFIYIFVQITSIEQWTLQHYQDFLSLMMEILLISDYNYKTLDFSSQLSSFQCIMQYYISFHHIPINFPFLIQLNLQCNLFSGSPDCGFPNKYHYSLKFMT